MRMSMLMIDCSVQYVPAVTYTAFEWRKARYQDTVHTAELGEEEDEIPGSTELTPLLPT